MGMIDKVDNYSISHSNDVKSLNVSAMFFDDVTVPVGQAKDGEKLLSKSEITKNMNEIITYNQNKLIGLKKDMKDMNPIKKFAMKTWFALLRVDNPEKVVSEGEKLCFDEEFLQSLRDFATSSDISDFGNFLSDENKQNEILQLIKKYTVENGYNNVSKLLEREIVHKETKKYLNEASKVF